MNVKLATQSYSYLIKTYLQDLWRNLQKCTLIEKSVY